MLKHIKSFISHGTSEVSFSSKPGGVAQAISSGVSLVAFAAVGELLLFHILLIQKVKECIKLDIAIS
jgi:hypothetical protein